MKTHLHTLVRAAGLGSARDRHVLVEAGAWAVGILGAMTASVAGLAYEARTASTEIQTAERLAARGSSVVDAFDWQGIVLNGDGVYAPDGTGPVGPDRPAARTIAILGDSLSVGFGCSAVRELPGVSLARGSAAALGRPVRVATYGVTGATTSDLASQAESAIADGPDAAVITIGANDVLHRLPPRRAARRLGAIVRDLRAHQIAVVVATCPDLGVILPIRQPLRRIVGRWSRLLARRQERAVDQAGGQSVALDRLVSPAFYGHPDLFFVDHFHPSGPGYAKAVAALLPVVADVLR